MELKIMSLDEACDFLPTKATYTIRIYSGLCLGEENFNLKVSKNYVRIAEYKFDDTNLFLCNDSKILFSDEIAFRLINDFNLWKGNIESLMVHCMRGKNRSPAVAIALNEIFDLGNDTIDLKSKYNSYNQYIYKTLLEIAIRGNFTI